MEKYFQKVIQVVILCTIFATCFNIETNENAKVLKIKIIFFMDAVNRIIVDHKVKKQLLGLGTYPTIRKALDGYAGTPQAIRIREAAITAGGVELNSKGK